MSDLANTLREKSKRDDALIVGSEIRAALQEQRIEIERLQSLLDAEMESNHRLAAEELRLREALEIEKEAYDFLAKQHEKLENRLEMIEHESMGKH